MKALQLFILTLFIIGLSFADEEKCPKTSIKPCSCRTYLDGACIITCTLSSQGDLERLANIPNLCDGNVHFNLVHSKVKGIPVKLWKMLLSSPKVDVTIQHSGLEGLAPPDGEYIPKTSTPGEAVIKIDHSKVGQWDWKQLSNLYSEGELTFVIDDTPLNELDASFSRIAGGRVHKVSIDRAGLSSIPDELFVPFDDLISLSLQNNELTSVSRSMLAKPAKSLHFLSLNGNRLTTLPHDLFSEMPVLEMVYLRDNRFQYLEPEVFKAISSPKLRRIDLVSNPWICTCRLLGTIQEVKQRLNMGTCAEPPNMYMKKVSNLQKLLGC